MNKYNLLFARYYIELPEIMMKRAIVNVQSTDKHCVFCVVSG